MATNDKYDRQLRLWGASGQRALSNTTVILLRVTAAGTETLKNLVLPGIGRIVIVDDSIISNNGHDDSYCSNFFLDSNSNNNAPRAKVALDYLTELNPDVQGTFQQTENLETFNLAELLSLNNNNNNRPQHHHTVVVGSDLEPHLLLKFAKICETSNIPFVHAVNYGLMGIVRLQTPPDALPILDPKPRDAVPDLRLVKVFPKLAQLADSIDMKALPNHQHAHVPYPIVLLQLIKTYQSQHNNDKLPSTFAEKQQFQQFIKASSRNYDNELNFQEAVQYAYLAYTEKDLDHLVELKQSATGDLANLLSALETFVETYGQPPVTSKIPDMTSSTEWYIALQNVYKQQADLDRANFKKILCSQNSSMQNNIEDEIVDMFLANIYHVDVLSTRSINFEWNEPPDAETLDELAMAIADEGQDRPDQVPLLWYLGWRACGLFYQTFGRYPGTSTTTACSDDDSYSADVPKLQECVRKIVVDLYKLHDNETVQEQLIKSDKIAQELTRYGNAEIHNVASIVGGVASQEVVKIVTGQYVPINHTYIYNGISSMGAVYKL